MKDHDIVQPMAAEGTGYVRHGDSLPRIDGHAKVTGQARYSAEYLQPGTVHGVVVNSTIARGRIQALHLDEARAVHGVIDILWHGHRPKIRKLDLAYKDFTAPAGSPFKPLASDAVLYSGQPVALVLAETWEAARYAASLVRVEYAQEPHRTNLLADLVRRHEPSKLKAGFSRPPKPKGDPDGAFAAAPVQVDAEYYGGVEHHNPMEMHATTVLYGAGGHLTVYDKSQGSQNVRMVLQHVFGLSKKKLTVRNAFVGGAFGSGCGPPTTPSSRPWRHCT